MDGTLTDTMRLQPYLIKNILLSKSTISFIDVQKKMASIYYRNKFTWFKPKTPILFAKVFKISVFRMFLFTPILILQYWRALQKERLFNDCEVVLKILKDKKYLIGLATNGTDFEVEIKIPSIVNFFDFKITSSDVTHKKPNPEMILKGINKAGVQPNETLYVGDTVVDFLASKNAKTHFALMTTGTFGPEVVNIGKEKPSHVFSNLQELKNFILQNSV
jgi:HAD superfamily hydrolase (TIGR01509 family)